MANTRGISYLEVVSLHERTVEINIGTEKSPLNISVTENLMFDPTVEERRVIEARAEFRSLHDELSALDETTVKDAEGNPVESLATLKAKIRMALMELDKDPRKEACQKFCDRVKETNLLDKTKKLPKDPEELAATGIPTQLLNLILDKLSAEPMVPNESTSP